MLIYIEDKRLVKDNKSDLDDFAGFKNMRDKIYFIYLTEDPKNKDANNLTTQMRFIEGINFDKKIL